MSRRSPARARAIPPSRSADPHGPGGAPACPTRRSATIAALAEHLEPPHARPAPSAADTTRRGGQARRPAAPPASRAPFHLLNLPDELIVLVGRHLHAHPYGLPAGALCRRLLAVLGDPREVARRAVAYFGSLDGALRQEVARAGSGGRADTVRLLLESGADPGAEVAVSGSLPLVLVPALAVACRNGNVDVAGAIVKHARGSGRSLPAEAVAQAAWACCAGGPLEELAPLLADLPAGRQPGGATLMGGSAALIVACISEQIRADAVKFLLCLGVDPDARDGSGASALTWAVRTGSREKAEALLDGGASLHVREAWSGRTLLMTACAVGKFEVAEMLIEHGAEVDAVDGGGRTALDYAESYIASAGTKGPMSLMRLLRQMSNE